MSETRCKICLHPRRSEIEAETRNGTPYGAIARTFEVSRAGISRHKDHPARSTASSNNASPVAQAESERVRYETQRLAALDKLRAAQLKMEAARNNYARGGNSSPLLASLPALMTAIEDVLENGPRYSRMVPLVAERAISNYYRSPVMPQIPDERFTETPAQADETGAERSALLRLVRTV